MVKFLLLNGAPPNKGDFFGLTPLARAVGRDAKEIGEVLVEFGGEMEDPSLTRKEKDFYQLVLRMLQGYPDALYQHSLRVAEVLVQPPQRGHHGGARDRGFGHSRGGFGRKWLIWLRNCVFASRSSGSLLPTFKFCRFENGVHTGLPIMSAGWVPPSGQLR